MLPGVATPAAELDGELTTVCPSCGVRDVEDARTGFCARCAGERAAESYLAAESEAIATRREAWANISARARDLLRPSDRERQRRHRMLERIRPREPAPPHADPFQVAEEALFHLGRLHATVRHHPTLAPDLEAAEELIRQLAWGPER